ncbi:hypothetical protein D3C75_1084130 [compost metagenome]
MAHHQGGWQLHQQETEISHQKQGGDQDFLFHRTGLDCKDPARAKPGANTERHAKNRTALGTFGVIGDGSAANA